VSGAGASGDGLRYPPRVLEVRVPGSTSNLGPGYDALGLAVDRYLSATWHPEPGTLRVEFGGALAGLDPARDLVHRVIAAGLGVEATGLGGRLVLESGIPVARGLGSSAAARTAGALLALCAKSSDDVAPQGSASHPTAVTAAQRAQLLIEVSEGEGHPDNATPSIVGGFVATAFDEGRVRWAPLPLSPDVGIAYAAPPVEVRTDEARDRLPEQIPHGDAAANGSRLAMLLSGLANADGDRVRWGMVDHLHVPWRWSAVPLADRAAAAARDAGAWGVTLSGSGSGLLAFSPRDHASDVAQAMAEVFGHVEGEGPVWAFPLRKALVGATVVLDLGDGR
jgi:homoserine kinase